MTNETVMPGGIADEPAPRGGAAGGAWGHILDLVDAPARQAFLLAARPGAALGVLLGGIAVVGGGGALAALATGPAGLPALVDAAWSVALVLPSAAIFGAYARLSLSPAAWLGAGAVSFVTAAVVVLSTAPLLVYLSLVARAGPWVPPTLLLASVVLVALGATLGRILQAADPGPPGVWAARLLGLALGGAFIGQLALGGELTDILQLAEVWS